MKAMKMTVKCVAVAAFAMVAMAAHATQTDILVAQRADRGADVKPGQWHADLVKARAYAEANGLPLVAVWSNGDFCQHCLIWEGAANSPVFVNWMKTSGMVFYFGYVRDGSLNAAGDFGGGPSPDGQEGYHGTSFYWCCNNQNASLAWPYIRFYWPKGGVDLVYTGSFIDGEYIVKGGAPCMVKDDLISTNPSMYAPWVTLGDYGTYNPNGRYMLDFITNKSTGVLRNFSATPAYAGGEFNVLSSATAPRACLQVETNTTLASVTVPLIRKAADIRAYAATNYVVCTYPSGQIRTNTVIWVAKQKSAEMALEISPDWLGSKESSIKLELYDHAMAKKSTLRVAVVAPVENSAANPLWLGERTVDSLDWGEWTMDIDTATQKVAKAVAGGEKAYTLALVSGSLWCPDCYVLDEYLLDKEEFHAWTTNRHVACVEIDEPIFAMSLSYPTLLSHTSYESKTYGTISGSGWLSRHGVPLTGNGNTNAATVLARNTDYVNKDTAHGGLCLPEPEASTARKTGGWKTGVPGIVLLRPDGSVAGRIYQFSNDGRNTLKDIPVETLLKRFDELLAQVEEEGEENNDSVRTTAATISGRDRSGKSASVSFTDQADYYRIDAPGGTDITFDLSADSYSNLVVSVVNGNLEDPDAAPIVSDSNTNGTARVRCQLPSGNCYVKVSYALNQNMYPVDDFFALAKDGSTLCTYTLASDSVFSPQETMHTQTITDGEAEATVSLIKGQAYKFTGLDAEANKDVLTYNETTQLWTASVSGAVTLVLEPDGGGNLAIGYQKWTPGMVGFVRATGFAKENGNDESADYDYQIQIWRTGGVSGCARAKIVLKDSSITNDLVAASIYSWTDQSFEWGEGSNNTQNALITIKGNKFPDGDQWLEFSLVEATPDKGDAAVSGTFRLTITDDDEKVAGQLRIVQANGVAVPANRRVVAKGGSELTVAVDRVDGVAGTMTAVVSIGGDTKDLLWTTRDGEIKSVAFALPDYAPGGSNKAAVRLTGLDGTAVDSTANYLTVEIVPATSADFEETDVHLSGVRNVRFATRAVNVKGTSLSGGDVSKVSVAKIAGSLAPGLSWEFDPDEGDAGAVLISGTPSKAGEYAAVFQVSEADVPGGTVTVAVNVEDPATAKDKDTPAVNPYLAVTRTIQNVMVISNDCLIGLMTVTVPPSGRLSAKYRPLMGDALSLMSTNWSDCASGDYTAELDPVTEDAAEYGLTVTAKADGAIEVKFTNSVETLECIVPTDEWSGENPAKSWEGYYTVSLPVVAAVTETLPLASGAGYVTLRMSTAQAVKSGKMAYAGVLPDGQAFSGISVLASVGKDALLPVVWGTGVNRFSAVFVLNQSADKFRAVWPHRSVKPYWLHGQVSAPSASYASQLDIYGTLYTADSILNIEACCLDTFKTHYLTFFALPGELQHCDRFERGDPVAWNTNSTTVFVRQKDGNTKITLLDREAAKANNGLTLSFNPSSGIVSGSLTLDFVASSVTARYRGVVLPGWGVGEGCGECTDSDATKRPFISGTCWFNDRYDHGGDTATVRRSCSFSVGVQPGK